MFTDLVGSTELSTRVGAAEAERLRGIHFGMLRDALADHDGREVKNLGDGIMAVFSGVGAALDAAVAMQQAFDRHNATGDEVLVIRVGVATGDCTEDDGDFFGEPVIIAARLCAKASDGQILAPEMLRILAPRGRHEFAPVGELDLKGIPEPVGTAEVVWHPAEIEPPEAIPLPDRLAIASPFAFVGRDTEREVLREAWKAVAAGDRRVVLLSGEAGLGKTRLSTELAHEAFDAGGLVLYGRCDEEVPSPYRPWVEALGYYLRHASDEALTGFDTRVLGELAAAVPAIRDRRPDLVVSEGFGGDGDQYVLFAAVTAFLTAVAAERPVMIVLDDLHWADRGTLQLLRHVVGQAIATGLMVVGTYRETDISVDDPLTAALAALRREPGVQRVGLAGLSDDDVLTLLEATAGHEMDADGVGLAHALRMETAGNPFFVGEMLRHLAETGQIVRGDDGRWAATATLDEVGLPESVREVVGARLRRLGEQAQQVLGAAAVVGREFDATLVAGVVDLDVEAVFDLLEPAISAGLVAEVANQPDRLTFTHALVQHTLYEDLSANRRVRWHRKVAMTIEALDGGIVGQAAALATHWFAATRPTDLDKAITFAILAGDEAIAAFAPADAVGWYRQALDAITDRDSQQCCDVMIRLGDAQRQAGDAAHRQTLLDAAALAQHLGDTSRLAAAALANNGGHEGSAGDVDTKRVEVLEAALEQVGSAPGLVRARLLGTLAIELDYAGTLERRVALADEALTIARQMGDAATLVTVINQRNEALRLPETLDERFEMTLEAMRIAEELGDLVARFHAARQRIYVSIERGDRDERDRCLRVVTEIADRVAQPMLSWHCLTLSATIALLDGDDVRAEQLSDQGLAVGLDSGQPDALVYYGSALLNARINQGRFNELLEMVAEAVEENPGLPFRAALAWGYADFGREDEARAMLDDVSSREFEDHDRDEMWLVAIALWANTAISLKATGPGAALYEMLSPWAGQFPNAVAAVIEPVDLLLGCLAVLIGRDAEADAHFAAAEDLTRNFGTPFFIARTLVERACLDAEDNSALVQARAREALAIASDHGYARVESEAAFLLAAD